MRRIALLFFSLTICVLLLSGCSSHSDQVKSSAQSVAYVTAYVTAKPTTVITSRPDSSGQSYVLNTNTHKFHKPSCSSVKQMKDKNKLVVTWSRQEIIDNGYNPCGRCHP